MRFDWPLPVAFFPENMLPFFFPENMLPLHHMSGALPEPGYYWSVFLSTELFLLNGRYKVMKYSLGRRDTGGYPSAVAMMMDVYASCLFMAT
jgi:hypothetical protein